MQTGIRKVRKFFGKGLKREEEYFEELRAEGKTPREMVKSL